MWRGGGLGALCILLPGKALTSLLLIVLSPAHLSSCWGSGRPKQTQPSIPRTGSTSEAAAPALGFPGPPSPTAAVQFASGKKETPQGKRGQHCGGEEGCCGGEGGSWPGRKLGYCSDPCLGDLGHAAQRAPCPAKHLSSFTGTSDARGEGVGWVAGCMPAPWRGALPSHGTVSSVLPSQGQPSLGGRDSAGRAMSLQHCSPQLLARPRGKHCALVVLTPLPSPAPGSAPPTFSGAQHRANRASACPQGNDITASRCPRMMDRAHGSVPLTWVCGGEGVGAWGKVLPARRWAAAPRLGSGGRAGRGLLTCLAQWFACWLPPSWELPLPMCLKITR